VDSYQKTKRKDRKKGNELLSESDDDDDDVDGRAVLSGCKRMEY
jgi:hypothetical protein